MNQSVRLNLFKSDAARKSGKVRYSNYCHCHNVGEVYYQWSTVLNRLWCAGPH